MQSRSIYISTAVAAVLTLLLSAPVFGEGRSYIELRTYKCATTEKRDALMGVFDRALIPALNQQGISKVGVFTTSAALNKNEKRYDTMLYTVLVHPDLSSFATCENKLLADKKYRLAAAPIFTAPMNDPMYDSCKSSLLCTVKSCPVVKKVATSPDRLMQLRIYNSYTIERNAKKISMFEAGGELQLFRDAGMPPVFFGHAIAGEQLANLTYMLSFETEDEKKRAWKMFLASSGWKKLKSDPQYRDTANKITNIILKPSRNSQL